jgi:hypothetical protein
MARGGPFSGVDELETMISHQRDKLFVLSAGNDLKPVNKHALAAQGKIFPKRSKCVALSYRCSTLNLA